MNVRELLKLLLSGIVFTCLLRVSNFPSSFLCFFAEEEENLMHWIQATISMLPVYLLVWMRRICKNIFHERARCISGFLLNRLGLLYLNFCSCYTSNLPMNSVMTTFHLISWQVLECRLVLDPRTRESRGFGFVTMDHLEDAERCIKYLNRSTLEGRMITVEKVSICGVSDFRILLFLTTLVLKWYSCSFCWGRLADGIYFLTSWSSRITAPLCFHSYPPI